VTGHARKRIRASFEIERQFSAQRTIASVERGEELVAKGGGCGRHGRASIALISGPVRVSAK